MPPASQCIEREVQRYLKPPHIPKVSKTASSKTDDDTTAQKSIAKSLGSAPKKWMVDANGNREHLHDTPSRTRSRTLLEFMTPTPLLSDPTRQGKPAFEFGQARPLVAKSCPLCKNGRSRGHTIIHDFTLGPNAIEPYMFSWAGIWTEQSRNRGSSNATPRQRKTKKVEEDGKKVDGEVEDSVDEEEEGGREEGTVGEGGTADRFGEDDEDVFPLEGGGDDDE
ncbi:hypothetical protein PtrV1_08306 [Pyrenophora tritici-repentis]|nr:hypothetical protein PtrV1_08306 [Pyrenophora tritici-repentis]